MNPDNNACFSKICQNTEEKKGGEKFALCTRQVIAGGCGDTDPTFIHKYLWKSELSCLLS